MRVATIIVTRSRSCHVKALHTVLRFNIQCMQKNVNNELVFVNDDPFAKSEKIQQYMKTHDRIFFIDFGVCVDADALQKVVDVNDNYDVIVFPGVKEGVDWDMFKTKVKQGSSEPVSQMGLHFDTEVGACIDGDMYNVRSTTPKIWVMMNKNVQKKIRDRRTGTVKIPPKSSLMFEKFKESGVKIVAYTSAEVTSTYTHECFGNILNSSGIKST